ncbi:ABC transporter permease [Marinomonas algarum]|uniref:ABC transporter permease subunit n=1 Tax=Marinomonas algarum TaxID=2883105 RepID=A0A9X1RSS3_9GAMM|nr:ABC transporter permease subunit [Marinomonas algarum]MCB5163190.1 ABC transporter permease subunit [Marinomonas algarum]
MISIWVLAGLTLLGFTLSVMGWPNIEMTADMLTLPSLDHWLGTDILGQDVFLRLLAGLPNTLLIAMFCGLLPIIMGFILASISIISRYYVSRFLQKFVEVFLLIPSLLPLMLLAAVLEPGLVAVILLISVLSWPDDFKVLRSAILRVIQSDAILTARHFGANNLYIMSNYVWPTIKPLLIMLFLQNARHAVMMSAGLAFLGLTDPR